ncbi:hypothetical protein COB55_04220 [Candidatus Wolfebacteria bacterium]|nr:MAG: hypothetical protein COB55_04220 [Candidatus Wolfebacteria bacterium]
MVFVVYDMNIISLNAWEGKLHKDLLTFVDAKSTTTDIFCFQEMCRGVSGIKVMDDRSVATLYDDIQKLLPDHVGYFAPVQSGVFELAMFIHKDITVTEHDDFLVYLERDAFDPSDPNSYPRSVQYSRIQKDGKEILIANLHGLWKRDVNKMDIPERIKQSEIIRDFLNAIDTPKILIGDYNLLPDTDSMAILDTEMGMKNLIAEYGITNTRNPNYSAYYGAPHFADYCHVSKEIYVRDFKVLPDVVSDHQPLLIDFSLR